MMILFLYFAVIGITFIAMFTTIFFHFVQQIQLTVLAASYIALMCVSVYMLNVIVEDHMNETVVERYVGEEDLGCLLTDPEELMPSSKQDLPLAAKIC
jgi:hypothetical protein